MKIKDDLEGMRTHAPERCAGQFCCVHNPSDHSMRDWPRHFRYDRYLMERVCEHGVGHPDPDDLAFKRRNKMDADGTHGCCGCCRAE